MRLACHAALSQLPVGWSSSPVPPGRGNRPSCDELLASLPAAAGAERLGDDAAAAARAKWRARTTSS